MRNDILRIELHDEIAARVNKIKLQFDTDDFFVDQEISDEEFKQRVKKTFTDKEKDDFLRDVFDYIFKFFKNSLEELEERNSFIDSNIERIDSQTFTVKIYKEEKLVNECKIWRGADFGSSQTIKYSNSISNRNSYNMMFTVNDDGYTQYLESSGLNPYVLDFDDNESFNEKGASEQMWAILIEPLQR